METRQAASASGRSANAARRLADWLTCQLARLSAATTLYTNLGMDGGETRANTAQTHGPPRNV